MIALSDSGARAMYGVAASTLAHGVHADRAVIVYKDEGGELVMGGFHGFEELALSESSISLAILSLAATEGRSILSSDARRDHEMEQTVSLQLSGAVSVLCVPLYDANGFPMGAMYADTTARSGVFRRKELMFARECGLWLEGYLKGETKLAPPKSPTLEVVPASPPAAAPGSAAAGPKPRRERIGAIPIDNTSPEGLMVFFRSFAALTKAGVMIHDGLDLLALSTEDIKLSKVLQELSDAVRRGQPLSAAMERYPRAFSPYLRALVRVGERTGRLVHVLDILAIDLEKRRQLILKLRSALTYPIVLSLACAVMMLLGPPYMLAGHLKVLQQSGIPLPWSTQALIVLSAALRNPVFLLLLAGLAAGLASLARRESVQRAFIAQALRAPVIGKVLKLAALVGFTRSLALQLRAGITALEALGHARETAWDPYLAEALREAARGLRDGATVTEALQASGYFPRDLLSFIDAGESSGTLERLTGWVADFYEREVETSLATMTSLLEPLVLAGMGTVTAVLLVATLRPSLTLLQSF